MDSYISASAINIRCFIEGIEFPLVSGRGMFATIGGPLMLQVQVVTAGDPHFFGRTITQVFYYDSREYLAGIVLYEGEMMAYQYHLTPGGGTTIMTLVSSKSYESGMLLNLLQQAANTVPDEAGKSEDLKKLASTVGEKFASFSGGILVPQYEAVMQALFTAPTTQRVGGLLGGLIHMKELFVGIQKGKKRKLPTDTFNGVAEYRLNLLQRVASVESDNTISNMIKLGSTKKWLRKVLKGVRGQQSLSYDALKGEILRRVHYQSINCCAAHFRPERQESRKVSVYSGLNVGAEPLAIRETLGRVLKDWEKTSGEGDAILAYDPPSFGAIGKAVLEFANKTIPDAMFQYFAGQDELIKGGMVDASVALPGAALVGKSGAYFNKDLVQKRTKQQQTLRDLSTEAQLHLRRVAEDLVYIGANLPYTGSDRGAFAMANEDRWTGFTTNLKKADAAQKKWEAFLGHGTAVGTRTVMETRVSQYHEEILIPDLWFAMPPACNLLLDGMYSNISSGRNYASEPSRLLLIGPKVGYEGVYVRSQGQTMVVAPNLEGDVGKKILEDTMKGRYTLLPHEIFMGPQPMSVPITQALGLSEFESSGGTSSDGKYEGVSQGAPPDLQEFLDKAPMSRNFPFLQRVAHSSFMSAYYAGRAVSITGRFWPRLVAGLPIAFESRSSALLKQLFVGTLNQIDVSFTVRSITATYSISHVRGEREWEDIAVYMKMYKKQPYTYQSWSQSKNKLENVVLGLSMDRNPDPAEQLSVIAALSDVTVGAVQRLATTKSKKERDRLEALVQKAHEASAAWSHGITKLKKAQRAEAFSAQPAANVYEKIKEKVVGPGQTLIGDAGDERQAYDLGLANTVEQTQKVIELMSGGGEGVVSKGKYSMEFDDLCRPSWLDPAYNDDRIGPEVYTPLWGVTSMYDHAKTSVAAGRMTAELLAPAIGGMPPDGEAGQIDFIKQFVDDRKDDPYSPPLLRQSIIQPMELINFDPHAHVVSEAASKTGIVDMDLSGYAPTDVIDQVDVNVDSPFTKLSEVDPRGPRHSRALAVAKRTVATLPSMRGLRVPKTSGDLGSDNIALVDKG